MMKINNLFLVFILIILSVTLNAQECNCKIDSVYYINISGNLNNGRPVFTQLVIKNLDTLKFYINKMQNDFLCNVLQFSIFVTEPSIGFIEMNKCLGKDAEKEYKSFSKKIVCFNNECKEVVSFSDGQYTKLHLSIVKVISEFWILQTNFEQINNTSDAIQIPKECYNTEYYYKFKKIIEVIPLSRTERKSIGFMN